MASQTAKWCFALPERDRDVRFGSKADMVPSQCDVRFTPRKRTFVSFGDVSAKGQADNACMIQIKENACSAK